MHRIVRFENPGRYLAWWWDANVRSREGEGRGNAGNGMGYMSHIPKLCGVAQRLYSIGTRLSASLSLLQLTPN